MSIPALPSKLPVLDDAEPHVSAKDSIYVLFYRERRNPHHSTKNFIFKGPLTQAIARGRNHCETTNLVFIQVRPFMSNLDYDEKRHLGESTD